MKKNEEDKPNFFKWISPSEKEMYELIKAKAQLKQAIKQPQNTGSVKRINDTSAGFVNSLLLIFVIGFLGIIMATIMYFIINK